VQEPTFPLNGILPLFLAKERQYPRENKEYKEVVCFDTILSSCKEKVVKDLLKF
jgi:hypothetical protein